MCSTENICLLSVLSSSLIYNLLDHLGLWEIWELFFLHVFACGFDKHLSDLQAVFSRGLSRGFDFCGNWNVIITLKSGMITGQCNSVWHTLQPKRNFPVFPFWPTQAEHLHSRFQRLPRILGWGSKRLKILTMSERIKKNVKLNNFNLSPKTKTKNNKNLWFGWTLYYSFINRFWCRVHFLSQCLWITVCTFPAHIWRQKCKGQDQGSSMSSRKGEMCVN